MLKRLLVDARLLANVAFVNFRFKSDTYFRLSVGKMGSKTRAGPGILKLKTGFSDITSKILVHFN